MNSERKRILLVGDNPFHGISHLSQERGRARSAETFSTTYAASLVVSSLANGADGFMFSVDETTLSILRQVREMGEGRHLGLYAMVPYAFEYVRLATQIGSSGLAKIFAKQLAVSGNIRAIAMGLKAAVRADPTALLKTYLIYEISRIKSSAGKSANIESVLLHEIATDMALGFNLDWFFRCYTRFLLDLAITPGFNTRNFSYLVRKFEEWNIDFQKIIVVAPFNKVGFQMNPNKTECEKSLANLPVANTIALSILAAGYLEPSEAVSYLKTLPNLKGVVVGVSKEEHAYETFKILKENLV
jgi:hypothetical protein